MKSNAGDLQESFLTWLKICPACLPPDTEKESVGELKALCCNVLRIFGQHGYELWPSAANEFLHSYLQNNGADVFDTPIFKIMQEYGATLEDVEKINQNKINKAKNNIRQAEQEVEDAEDYLNGAKQTLERIRLSAKEENKRYTALAENILRYKDNDKASVPASVPGPNA